MNDYQDEEVMGFTIDITDDEVRTMYYAVTEAIRTWPGAPARPAEEQESLFLLRDSFFRMLLEVNYDIDGKRGEGEA